MAAEESPVEIMPSMQLLAEAAQEQEKLPERDLEADDDDSRSSSLSELEDNAGTEGSDAPDTYLSEAEDDGQVGGHEDDDEDEEEEDEEEDEEAEPDNEEDDGEDADDIARIEGNGDNPDEEDDGNDTEAETERLQESPEKRRPSRSVHLRASDVLQVPDENLDQTSEISALSDSEPEGISNVPSIVSSPRKRKRDESDDEDTTVRSLKKVSRKLEDHVNEDEDDDDLGKAGRVDRTKDPEEEVSDDEHDSSKEPTPEREAPAETEEKEEDGSAADEADAEGVEGEAEATAKSEEDAAKKEAALSDLRAIEKDFALLRDKLFAEKLKQLNEELELLRHSPYSHSDFTVAAAAVARRRDEQKQIAMTIFEHNVRNLQKTCIAERSMAHCQYIQEVRRSREEALDQAGHEWYRIQRERRRAEEDESEKRHHYNRDRSIQIAAQQAYNREVSILSGLQKYVGFPAAPVLEGVPEAERADDLKKMGVSNKPAYSMPRSAPISSFPRQLPQADEAFLEKNPWANPAQVYGPQAMNVPAQSTPGASFTTPAPPRRQADPQPQNSASTIAVSSVEQTPMSNQAQPGSVMRLHAPPTDSPNETPSRNAGSSRPEVSITDASPANGSVSRNGVGGAHAMTNGVNGLTVAKASEEISPRSSPLKTAQAQTVSAGSS